MDRADRLAISFRPLTRADFPLLTAWLNEPHVCEWWRDGPRSVDDVAEKYGPSVDGIEPTKMFVVGLDEQPIGMIETYRIADDADWQRALGADLGGAGIDYLIGDPGRCGRGVGSAMIVAFVPMVFELYPDVRQIVSAPQRDNRASCRVLEKAGFTLVDERLLDSDDPSDAGVSAVYRLGRSALG